VTIPPSVARQLIANGSLTQADVIDAVIVINADGNRRRALRWRLRSITIGVITLRDVVCDIGKDENTALLGQTVLRRFASWSIDNRRRVLRLEGAQ
jgi:predicted aspartyl protease